MAKKSTSYVDLENGKFDLGPDYSTGPMSVSEVWNFLLKYVKESTASDWKKIDEFIIELRKGDTRALLIAALSVLVSIWMIYLIIYAFTPAPRPKKKVEEKPRDPPKDFTIEQLRVFDGTNDKPIYIGLCGDIFDVSDAPNYYGVGASYHCFAGRDSSRAMAKFSFEEELFENPDVSDLGPFEKSMMDDWHHKFKYYRNYPIIGKLSKPPSGLEFKRENLANYKGQQEVPSGRVDAPIYVAINGKVFDVSYGGKELYCKGGPYERLAGIDASRSLAKMSFSEDSLNGHDLSDLTEEQRKTLADWERKFEKDKKYPIVGNIIE